MPDGSFIAGKQGEEPPHPDAVWRSYYECARQILELYRKDLYGYGWIAEELNRQGWVFRDCWNNPRPLKLDDVRRVTSAWREYAGMVLQGKAANRIAAKLENPTSVLFDTGRAVFELGLLRAVAETQASRSVLRRPEGMVYVAHVFPLADLLYCARCEDAAQKEDQPEARSRIIGHQKQKQSLRYRHSERRRCGCQNQSVLADEVEGDFRRLVDTLQVRPETIQLMAELAVQTRFGGVEDEVDLEEQKKIAIAKHRRALKNNLILFQNGDVEAEEYFRQKDYHERQIAYWEAQTTDKKRIALELTTTMEMVNRLKKFWDITEGEDRRLLAHSLFDEIVYDLDEQRIVDFKIKSWAEPFLILRAALYHDLMGEEMKNRFNSGLSSRGTSRDPNGTRTRVLALKGPRPRPLDDGAERASV